MTTTYVPRKGKRRNTIVVDAFDTSWLVLDQPNRTFIDVEHVDAGWTFGIKMGSRYADQVCWVDPQ